MKILYHIPYPKALGADRWIYEGWRDAFVDVGHSFFEVTAGDVISEKLETVKPDIFMTAMNIIDPVRDVAAIQKARKQGTKAYVWIHWPPDVNLESWNDLLKNHDVADVYFGEREPEGMYDFEQVTGKKYFVIPNAANKKLHFPTDEMIKYQYDIVFLGANLPLKHQLFSKILKPLMEKYKVGLFGPGWTLKDKFLKVVQKLARNVNMIGFANWINEHRITVPVDEENALYSSAKICLNFHEREPDGSQPHYIVNQRAFKIPACGGFELCDHVPAIRNYFEEDELTMASLDPNEWIQKIDYYLTHESERKAVQEKGTARALRDHTYHNRVDQVMDIYKTLS